MLQINNVNCRKQVFRILMWAAIGVFSGACGTHHPTDRADQETMDPVSQIVHFYQGPLDHLSAVRYGSCPMEPHCSEYSLMAIERHGPFTGLVMTFDRLIRCGGDEVDLSPEVIVNGRRRTYDPVEANEWNAMKLTEENSQWKILVE